MVNKPTITKGADHMGMECFAMLDCRILRSVDGGKLHVSVSTTHRLPTWEEMKRVRYELMPNKMYVGIILPPKEEYVNEMEFCHHLWEL